jgi:hypothetical protein
MLRKGEPKWHQTILARVALLRWLPRLCGGLLLGLEA